MVVDASAALGACLKRRGMEQISRYGLVAPPLMWSEATSALHRAIWRGDAAAGSSAAYLSRLLEAPIERRTPDGLYEKAWEVSDELGWANTYDAEYVALASMLGCSLLTEDARLKRGAERLIEVLGPSDL